MGTIERLGEDARPDVILAEPVGSCTDLVATVIQPLKRLYDAEFSIAPYAVILKPNHGRRILSGDRTGGFSPKAEYILTKQLEEADVVLVNRIDELLSSEAEELESLVRANFRRLPCCAFPLARGRDLTPCWSFSTRRETSAERFSTSTTTSMPKERPNSAGSTRA